MKTKQELLIEHRNRIKRAVALEKPLGRVPIILAADLFAAKYADPGLKPSDFLFKTDYANRMVIEGMLKLGKNEIDGNVILAMKPGTNGMVFFSKTKFPGRELPEDALWQIDEVGPMEVEDYDLLLSKGYQEFSDEMLFNRLGYNREEVMESYGMMAQVNIETESEGIYVVSKAVAPHPFDMLAPARGMANFLVDLHRRPDKVKEALDVIFEDNVNVFKMMVKMSQADMAMTTFVRGSDEFISNRLFEKFVWPYTKKIADMAVEEGCDLFMHMDSKWDSKLEYFRELPAKRCIFDTDAATDIYKLKVTVGDMMCITGNVSAAMLCLGTADETYDYASRLIRDMGDGFIMSTSCCIPPNARKENVEAVLAAVLGK
jgi:hypothetical protein